MTAADYISFCFLTFILYHVHRLFLFSYTLLMVHMGFSPQFDIGIPLMTKCCNHHDRCYDTCGNKKNDCDEQFQSCLSKICRDVQKTLGISENVQGKSDKCLFFFFFAPKFY